MCKAFNELMEENGVREKEKAGKKEKAKKEFESSVRW